MQTLRRRRPVLKNCAGTWRHTPPSTLTSRPCCSGPRATWRACSHPAEQQRHVDELLALQNEDGGWSLASLGNWEYRGVGGEARGASSDGYGTGLVACVLRRSGVPVDDAHIVRAIGWLKSNQRANGGWFTPLSEQSTCHALDFPKPGQPMPFSRWRPATNSKTKIKHDAYCNLVQHAECRGRRPIYSRERLIIWGGVGKRICMTRTTDRSHRFDLIQKPHAFNDSSPGSGFGGPGSGFGGQTGVRTATTIKTFCFVNPKVISNRTFLPSRP